MNDRGQATLEALIIAAFCVLGLSGIFISGIRIIKNTLAQEFHEEQTLSVQKR